MAANATARAVQQPALASHHVAVARHHLRGPGGGIVQTFPKIISGTNYPNIISATSNKLNQTQDVGGTATVVHDAAGSITSDGTNTYTYSDRGRLATMTNAGGTVTYSYNALELRVGKAGPTALVSTGATYYVYDEEGKLLGEYDGNGTPIYETIYLGSPVGVIKQTGTAAASDIAIGLYNVSTDQLGAPRVVTRQSDEAIVWRWDSAEAFGATAPDQNPAGLGTFGFNQRLPGQIFDAESGLLQNWNREYNPGIGRYMQSDPIGLEGGINTFAYVEGDPLGSADSSGLLIDTIADIGFIAYDIYKLVKDGECGRSDNLKALGLDVAGVLLPGATGLGMAYRASKVAKGASQELRYADRIRKRGLEDPVSHNFPYSLDKDILKTTPISKSNGYTIFQQPGSMAGKVVMDKYGKRIQTYKDGVYEIGVRSDGVIDHRFFRPNK